MNAFSYVSPHDTDAAVALVASDPGARFIAGGTNILDLMKDEVVRPSVLVDVNSLPLHRVGLRGDSVFIGSLARMSDVAEMPLVRERFPVVSQALLAGASPQLRNMATIGGNIMQRTRCAYFRDSSVACNKRAPGTGCPALAGVNRMHAILGGSEHCIATHASDLAVALVAMDARLHLLGTHGVRVLPLQEFYLLPETTPDHETVLQRGELIVGVELPAMTFARRSLYLKVRDRASYEFALAAAAVALDVQGGTIRGARLALGGIATVPWRAAAAETLLVGRAPTAETFAAAAGAALAGARGHGLNDFKIELARRTIVRALQQATASA